MTDQRSAGARRTLAFLASKAFLAGNARLSEGISRPSQPAWLSERIGWPFAGVEPFQLRRGEGRVEQEP